MSNATTLNAGAAPLSANDAFVDLYLQCIGWTNNNYIMIILFGWLLFLLAYIAVLKEILPKFLPPLYSNLDMTKQQSIIMKVVDSTTEFCMLFVVGTILAKRHILDAYPDNFTVQGERFFAMYFVSLHIVELLFRFNSLRFAVVAHHVVMIVNTGIFVGVQSMWTRTYFYLLGTMSFFTCVTFLKSIVVVAYHVWPEHERTRKMMTAVIGQEFLTKVILQCVNIAILVVGIGSGDFQNYSAWRYVLQFGSVLLFMPTQFHPVYIMIMMRRKLIARQSKLRCEAAAADPLSVFTNLSVRE